MLQPFTDDMVQAVLTADEHTPAVVKWLFDLLDERAAEEGVDRPEILHAWKANW